LNPRVDGRAGPCDGQCYSLSNDGGTKNVAVDWLTRFEYNDVVLSRRDIGGGNHEFRASECDSFDGNGDGCHHFDWRASPDYHIEQGRIDVDVAHLPSEFQDTSLGCPQGDSLGRFLVGGSRQLDLDISRVIIVPLDREVKDIFR
jgi:hypothetical protein